LALPDPAPKCFGPLVRDLLSGDYLEVSLARSGNALFEAGVPGGFMYKSMSILKKGVLLVAIPLTFQLVFLGLVLASRGQVERAQDLAIHTKVVIAKVEALYRKLAESRLGLRELVLSKDFGGYTRFDRALGEVKGQADDLIAEVDDNAPQQAKARAIARQADDLVAWQRGVAGLVREGKAAEALERLNDPEGPGGLEAIRRAIDEFRGGEEVLDKARVERLAVKSRQQLAVMISGGLASLVGSVVILWTFGRDLARRFAVLGENARRVAEGQELLAPVGGRDEIAELDQALHRMARSIDEKDRENELFIYSVSHDLRSPLVNLQGFSQELAYAGKELAELFRDPSVPAPIARRGLAVVDGEIPESIHFIQTAVSRLSVIIDALLRLSRVGRVEYRWQAVDVEATVRRVVEALRSTIAERGASVTAAPLPRAWGDPTAVEQIFANLVGNAVNYLDPDRPGLVEVGVVVDGEKGSNGDGHLTYYVKDNGMGIPESGMSKMFLAFQRFHEGRSRGEGIGLALVRKVVERHGGSIRVESTPGVGSTFFVELPAPPRDGQPSEPAAAPTAAAGSI
jgi:signal transduction histidine kinase